LRRTRQGKITVRESGAWKLDDEARATRESIRHGHLTSGQYRPIEEPPESPTQKLTPSLHAPYGRPIPVVEGFAIAVRLLA